MKCIVTDAKRVVLIVAIADKEIRNSLLSFEALQLQIYLVSRTIAVIDGI